jgi:hypothetical protein
VQVRMRTARAQRNGRSQACMATDIRDALEHGIILC